MKFQLSLVLGLVAFTPCNAKVDCAYQAANGDYGDKLQGLELTIAGMGAKVDMTDVDELKKMFPKCEWKSKAVNVKDDKWQLPVCTCTLGGGECDSCGYADICEQMCAKGANCGQVYYKNDADADKAIAKANADATKAAGAVVAAKAAEKTSPSFTATATVKTAEGVAAAAAAVASRASATADRTCTPLKVTRTCTANPSQKAHLQVGIESKGKRLDLKWHEALKTSKNLQGIPEFLQVSSLSVYFPQCQAGSISQTSIKVRDNWLQMYDCNKCGPKQDQACTQCELAEICGMLCSQYSKCKQFTLYGKNCYLQSAGSRHANVKHTSGKPIKMCYTWTQKGVDQAKTDKKEAEWGQPAADKHVSSKVEATAGFMKPALANGYVKRVTCPEAMVTGLAASLQPLWVALAWMAWVGMQ